jgi:hypothetical protein
MLILDEILFKPTGDDPMLKELGGFHGADFFSNGHHKKRVHGGVVGCGNALGSQLGGCGGAKGVAALTKRLEEHLANSAQNEKLSAGNLPKKTQKSQKTGRKPPKCGKNKRRFPKVQRRTSANA